MLQVNDKMAENPVAAIVIKTQAQPGCVFQAASKTGSGVILWVHCIKSSRGDCSAA